MEKIPTAKELFDKKHPQDGTLPKWAEDLMIEFAKLHVEQALKEASVNAETEEECGNPYDPEDYYYVVDRDSILNSYPLENIK